MSYGEDENELVSRCVERYQQLEHEDVLQLLEAFRSLLYVEDSLDKGPDSKQGSVAALRMPLSMIKQFATHSSLFAADMDEDLEITAERVTAILNGDVPLTAGAGSKCVDILRAWR